MILNTTVSTKRLTADGDDSDKESYVLVNGMSAIPANIQPASPEHTVLVEGVFGQVYRMFTTYDGFMVGDQVTDNTTNGVYVIKGIEDWNFPPLPHLEMTLVEMEE